jgi:hypothetical protein
MNQLTTFSKISSLSSSFTKIANLSQSVIVNNALLSDNGVLFVTDYNNNIYQMNIYLLKC